MLALVFASKRLKYLKKVRQITKDLWKKERKKKPPTKDNFSWLTNFEEIQVLKPISLVLSSHLAIRVLFSYVFLFLLLFFSVLQFLRFIFCFFFSILFFPELESPPSLYGRCIIRHSNNRTGGSTRSTTTPRISSASLSLSLSLWSLPLSKSAEPPD